jgi:hypothetical protein
MENTKEEDYNNIYMKLSKQNINSFINKNDFRKAFILLIIVLERLKNIDKDEFIDYYSKKLNTF